jgi:hypothetical protein
MRIGAFGGTSLASGTDALLQQPNLSGVSRAVRQAAGQFRAVARYPNAVPATLFYQGEQGVWYDPSDLSTMFQDAVGLIPVTDVEQPVRRILDKSGNNHHATASADARRPVLSARVNQLVATEAFDAASWTRTNLLVPITTEPSPVGTNTGDKLVATTTNGLHWAGQSIPVVSGVSYTYVVYVKAAEYTQIQFGRIAPGIPAIAVVINASDGSIVSQSGVSNLVVTPDGGWYRVSFTVTADANGTTGVANFLVNTANATSFAGNDSDGLFIWGADLRVTNDGVNLPAYQRVTTATDYDTAGFPLYLRFDGTDDCLFTGNVDFSATDEVTVCAGVRKLSDAATGTIAELSASLAANAGVFSVFAPVSAGATYTFASKGSIQAVATTATVFASPITNILSGIGDISGDSAALRVNGTQAAISTVDQGTGNYGTYPLFIGGRSDSSLRFNGRLYQLVVRGALTGTPVLEQLEGFVNAKTRAF